MRHSTAACTRGDAMKLTFGTLMAALAASALLAVPAVAGQPVTSVTCTETTTTVTYRAPLVGGNIRWDDAFGSMVDGVFIEDLALKPAPGTLTFTTPSGALGGSVGGVLFFKSKGRNGDLTRVLLDATCPSPV